MMGRFSDIFNTNVDPYIAEAYFWDNVLRIAKHRSDEAWKALETNEVITTPRPAMKRPKGHNRMSPHNHASLLVLRLEIYQRALERGHTAEAKHQLTQAYPHLRELAFAATGAKSNEGRDEEG